MKYLHFFTISLFVFLSGCNKTAVDPNNPGAVKPDPKGVDPLTIVRKVTDGWNKANGLGGGRNTTFKNHYYEFNIEKDNSIVDFLLTSIDTEIGFIVYDEFEKSLIEHRGSKSEKAQLKLNSGKYKVLVFSNERDAVGNYNFTITGIPKLQTKIKSNWLKTVDQSFGDLGGGGYSYKLNHPISFNSARNNFYTFEVMEDNAYIDIELEANSADCWFKLYNENESIVEYAPTKRNDFRLYQLNKGKYKVWIGTEDREAKTNYILNIYGKVANLTKIEFKAFKNSGTWPKYNSIDTYVIVVENDNSYIDFNITGNYDVDFFVYDSNDNHVSPDNLKYGNVFPNKRNANHYALYKKGTYEIDVEPSLRSKEDFIGIKIYTLEIVGNVKSLSKK